ncbi:MAG: cytochrome C [candidate division Zixibacteria bacterium]|nr:cytochrome C [candidate division Zixibacteria bacterium]
MSQIFPETATKYFYIIITALLVTGIASVGFIWYYFSPWYTDVGYQPKQPVPFSHKLHADDLGLDCRYCHSSIEFSAHANVPPTQTCMNCHKLILPESEKLLPIRESWSEQMPMKWNRVHKLPDYVYFDHRIHLNAGVGCLSCHGNIAQMEVVTLKKPLSMSWCLECHRDPLMHIRPKSEITNMDWIPPADQIEFGKRRMKEMMLNPTIDCTGCHR